MNCCIIRKVPYRLAETNRLVWGLIVAESQGLSLIFLQARKDNGSHALAIATENVGERVYEEVKNASRFNLELEDVLALANKLEALGDILGKNEFEKHFRFRDDEDAW